MDNSKYLHSIGVIYIFSHSGSPFRLWFYQIHRSKGWLKSIILSFLMMNNNLMNHNSHKTVRANPPLSHTSRTFQVLDALSHTLTQHAKFFWLYTRWNSLQNIWEQEFVCAFLLTLVRQLQNTTHQTLVKNRNQHRLKIYFKLLKSEKQNPFQDFFYFITRAIQIVYFNTLANCKYLKYIRNVYIFMKWHLLQILSF